MITRNVYLNTKFTLSENSIKDLKDTDILEDQVVNESIIKMGHKKKLHFLGRIHLAQQGLAAACCVRRR
jgi:hypothetical protein